MIHHGEREKVIRYDGVVPDDESMIVPTPNDPRVKKPMSYWKFAKSEPMDLPVPRFIIDDNYVGEPPKVEVTFDNLNDNIDKQFLGKQIQKFGEVDLITIPFHPITNKHLGLGKAVFKVVKSAKKCVSSLHGKTIMGRKVNCVLDPRGKLYDKMFTDLTRVKEPTPPPPDPVADQDSQQEEEEGWTEENGGWNQNEDWNRGAGDWSGESGFPGRPQWEDEEARHGWEDNGFDGGNDRWGERFGGHGKYGGPQGSRHNLDSNSSWSEQRSGRSRDRGRDRNNDFPRGRRQEREWRAPKLYEDVVEKKSETSDSWQDNAILNPAFTADTSSLPPPAIPVLPTPIPAAVSSATAVLPPEEGQLDEERSIDLDTRLQMLMKTKATNMPAFLIGSGTESSDTEAAAPPPPPPEPPKPSGPLSRTPSPFLTRDQYMASHTLTLRHEELDKVNQALANLPISGNQQTEGMSPISEHGDLFLQQQAPFPGGLAPPFSQSHIPGGPGYWQGHFPDASEQAWDPGQYNHQMWMDEHYSYNHSDNTYDHEMQEDFKSGERGGGATRKSGKDLLKTILDTVVKVVQSELKDILKKDINKKLCENYAFLLFDKWWSDQEANHKLELEAEFKKKAVSTSATTAIIPDREKVEALPRIPKPEDLGNFIEKQRESGTSTFGVGGSLGLGFRGSIPKFSKNPDKKPDKPQVPEKVKDHDKSDKKRKKDKHKDKEDEEAKAERREVKSSTVYNDIYSDTDSDKKSESSEVESTDDESSDKSSSSSSDSDSDDDDSSDSDASQASEKSAKSNRSVSGSRAKSRSKSPLRARAKSRSKSRTRSISRSKSRSKSRSRSRAKSRSRSLSPVKALSPVPRRSKSTSPIRTSKTPPTSVDTPKLNNEDKKGEEDSESGIVEIEDIASSSSSPTLSRPPTPVLTTPVKPHVVAVDSDTETGSEVEVIEEISTPRKDSTVQAAQALMALSAPKSSPVRLRHVESSPPHIMDHCYARPAPVSKPGSRRDTSEDGGSAAGGFDHDYTRPRTPPSTQAKQQQTPKEPIKALVPVEQRAVSKKKTALPSQPVKFKVRDVQEKFKLLYKFLTDGIDLEDIMYLKRSYEMMLNEGLNQPNLAWINDTHWVDHSQTLIPDPPRKKRRVDDFSKPHETGSARTEGYYKMDPREKMRTKYHFHRPGVDAFNTAKTGASQKPAQKAISLSREARSQQRRMLTALGDEFGESDLLKFNQLKFRRKAMKFGKSAIHDWGLFAMEHIGVDEMVIEYVGDVVRPLISDVREKRYEKQGIGSSYLFRIDQDYVVDATKCGNLARFINHSCEPNCYAKVIKIDGESKIVIYSKQPIAIGEEITYDYKFPIEDEKIRCLCGEKTCRKYLN